MEPKLSDGIVYLVQGSSGIEQRAGLVVALLGSGVVNLVHFDPETGARSHEREVAFSELSDEPGKWAWPS